MLKDQQTPHEPLAGEHSSNDPVPIDMRQYFSNTLKFKFNRNKKNGSREKQN